MFKKHLLKEWKFNYQCLHPVFIASVWIFLYPRWVYRFLVCFSEQVWITTLICTAITLILSICKSRGGCTVWSSFIGRQHQHKQQKKITTSSFKVNMCWNQFTLILFSFRSLWHRKLRFFTVCNLIQCFCPAARGRSRSLDFY